MAEHSPDDGHVHVATSGTDAIDAVDPADLSRLLDAIVDIGRGSDLPSVLHRTVAAATELAGARYGALGVLDETGSHLTDFVTCGLDDAEIARIGDRPAGKGLLGTLIIDPRPVRVQDLSIHPDRYGFPPGHPPMGSFLGVPIDARSRVFGNLYLCDKLDGAGFTARDEALVVALATAAGVVIDNVRLSERISEMRLVADRERIARDLHDTVIQRLFASGLQLQGVAARTGDPETSERLAQVIDDLDETVRHIRTTVFELQRPRLPGRSTRQEIIDMVEELVSVATVHAEFRFDGPIDLGVPDALADHLEATVREAVTNTVRHARATRVVVEVTVDDDVLVRITDDGRGLGEIDSSGLGLRNLHSRAAELGGTCSVGTSPDGGTVVEWRVPLPEADAQRPV